jgi:uncharacterized membrane protein HdeD (DUF308 family)
MDFIRRRGRSRHATKKETRTMNREIVVTGAGRAGLLAIGSILLVVGMLALGAPFVTSAFVVTAQGALAVAGGAVELFGAFRAKGAGALFAEILLALVHAGVGLYLMFMPGSGVIALTLLVGSYLVVAGALRTGAALAWRPRPGWGCGAAGGVLTGILGALVVVEWPGSSAWVIGSMLGLSWMTAGVSLVMLAWSARSTANAPCGGALEAS